MNEELEKQVNEAMENEFDGCETFNIVQELLGLREKNTELRGDRVAGMATERVLAAAHEKIEELQSKLTTAVDALAHIWEYWNRDENQGAMSDALDEILGTTEEALAAIRNEGESIKIRPMPDKCTICFAHPRIIKSCKHCNGTGKEPK